MFAVWLGVMLILAAVAIAVAGMVTANFSPEGNGHVRVSLEVPDGDSPPRVFVSTNLNDWQEVDLFLTYPGITNQRPEVLIIGAERVFLRATP